MTEAARLVLVKPPAGDLPFILKAATERIGGLLTNPLRFIELHGGEGLPARERRRLEPRRYSRRQAIDLVCQAFLKHVDLLSLRVGTPLRNGAVSPPGHAELAVETNLTLTRMRRAIRDGRRAGWWTAHQPRLKYTNDKGESAHCAFRVIYRLTDRFFDRLGLSRRLKRERDQASHRATARRQRIHPGPLLAARDGFRSLLAPRPRPRPTVDDKENEARLMNALMVRLSLKHPGWDPERVRAEARRLRPLRPSGGK